MDTTDFNLDTPLHASLLYHNTENTKLLLEHKANCDLANAKGRKPIHNANDAESLELLVDHGAAIDARDGNGKIFLWINRLCSLQHLIKFTTKLTCFFLFCIDFSFFKKNFKRQNLTDCRIF